MKKDLEITRDIVAAMSTRFNGDGRLAAQALRKISTIIRQHNSDDAKEIARTIMMQMGPTFEGNINQACDALERILQSMIVRK
ncbi:MAG: hypothetical protein ACYS8W_12265 [Planctomycetota bacterium]|jgi:hypothetical protein